MNVTLAMPATSVTLYRNVDVKRRRSLSFTLDQSRALQEKCTYLESGILKLRGAESLAIDQMESVKSGKCCSLCGDVHAGNNTKIAVERMRMTAYLFSQSRQKVQNKHNLCMAELEDLSGKHQDAEMQTAIASKGRHTDEWCSIQFNKGKVATLRDQKACTMFHQDCMVCGQKVRNFSDFLKGVDRQIGMLQSKLHTHIK